MTSTTILPILPWLSVSPLSGPPGTTVSVSDSPISGSGTCPSSVQIPRWIEITLTRPAVPTPVETKIVTQDASGHFAATLTIPLVDPPQLYSINARCAQSNSTVYYFRSELFDSSKPLSTTTTSLTEPTATTVADASSSTTVDDPSAAPTTLGMTSLRADPTTIGTVEVQSEAASAAANAGAALPRTGSDTSLLFLGTALVAGGVLLATRRRSAREPH
jgi:LPXTG-motif cell wall-anchored protein